MTIQRLSRTMGPVAAPAAAEHEEPEQVEATLGKLIEPTRSMPTDFFRRHQDS